MKVAEVVERLAAEASRGRGGARIHARVEAQGERVFTRPEHLQQVIRNLVDNALEYSPGGSRVEIVVQRGAIEVLDEGPGLPESVVRNLGTPFNRGRSPSSPTGREGHGLGLALVISHCRRYGWEFSSHAEGGDAEARPRHRVRIAFPSDES